MLKVSLGEFKYIRQKDIEGLNVSEQDKLDMTAAMSGAKVYVMSEDRTGFMTTAEALSAGLDRSQVFTGAEGIWEYLKMNFLEKDFPIYTEIEVPYEVYAETREAQWTDFSYNFGCVEWAVKRLTTIEKCKVPLIIQINEKYHLYCAIDWLNSGASNGKAVYRPDGKLRRALNDIDYDLFDGWGERMQKEFARREEEMAAMMDKAEQEAKEGGNE